MSAFERRPASNRLRLVLILLALILVGVAVGLTSQVSQGASSHAGLGWAARDTVAAIVAETPADKANGSWSDEFYFDGDLDGSATALWSRPEGMLASGYFTRAGNTALDYVGLWDGSRWVPMGAGLPHAVGVFAEYGGQIYAGAYRWDGATWENVLQTNGSIEAMVPYRGGLVVGGSFTQARGVDAPRLFTWDGQTVTPVEGAPDGPVYALAARDTLLAVGGQFGAAGGDTTARNVAVYDGYDWAGLGGGISGTQHWCCDIWGVGWDYRPFVKALTWQDDGLVVGGRFTMAGPESAATIASWDGQQWHALGSGITGWNWDYSGGLGDIPTSWPPDVRSFVIQDGVLFVGGTFPSAGGVASEGVARWDGTDWLGCAGGTHAESTTVEALAAHAGQVYLAGTFDSSPYYSISRGVIRWDGEAFAPVVNPAGLGVDWEVLALLPYGGDLIVAGSYATGGENVIHNIAAFDGERYSRLGDGDADGEVEALLVLEGDLVAGGDFDTIAGVSAHHVARWDGAAWAPLGEGLDFLVTAMAVHDGQLYAGGTTGEIWWPLPDEYKRRQESLAPASTGAGRLSRWDGSTWEPVLSANRSIRALASYGGRLYVGGEFTTVDELPASPIVGFDSTSGDVESCPLGNGSVYRLITWKGTLVVGGSFGLLDGEPTIDNLAFYDGSAWSVPARLTGAASRGGAYGLHVVGNQLFVVGNFTQAGDVAAPQVAMYDGTAWRGFGAGVAVFPFCAATYHGGLYVGGHFNFASGLPSRSFARWEEPGLPISLLSLVAERAGRAARVSWELQGPTIARALHVWRELPDGARARLTATPLSAAGAGAFTDFDPPPGEADYWLEELSADGGASLWHGPAHLPAATVPTAMRLDQNRPNPFNPRTTLTLALPEAGRTRLVVYDARGRRVATLLDAVLPAGEREVVWDGRDGVGRALPSGEYVARLETPGGKRSIKLTLAR